MAVSTAPHIANQVSAPGGFLEALPVLDTSIYASGDLLFDATEIPLAVTWPGGYGSLHSVEVLDEDAQGIAFDLLVLNAGDTLGSLNAAFAASAVLCRNVVAVVSVQTSDFVALGSARKRASVGSIGRLVQAAAGTQSLWVAAIARGTPTYTGNNLQIRLGFMAG